jgi:hypothetical protein
MGLVGGIVTISSSDSSYLPARILSTVRYRRSKAF